MYTYETVESDKKSFETDTLFRAGSSNVWKIKHLRIQKHFISRRHFLEIRANPSFPGVRKPELTLKLAFFGNGNPDLAVDAGFLGVYKADLLSEPGFLASRTPGSTLEPTFAEIKKAGMTFESAFAGIRKPISSAESGFLFPKITGLFPIQIWGITADKGLPEVSFSLFDGKIGHLRTALYWDTEKAHSSGACFSSAPQKPEFRPSRFFAVGKTPFRLLLESCRRPKRGTNRCPSKQVFQFLE